MSALLDAWAVLSPVSCAGCGADDRALCPACRASLVAHPRTLTIGGLTVTSALSYEGRVRRAVLALKEQARTDIARALAAPLRAAILHAADLATESAETGGGPVELVTIPPSRSSFRARGFDPVSLLLTRGRMPFGSRVLVHSRVTAAQKTLDRSSRGSNLAFSLRARHPLTGRRFLIVDDVVTTGSTLVEASRAISAASGVVVGAATLANTPKRVTEGGRPFDEHTQQMLNTS